MLRFSILKEQGLSEVENNMQKFIIENENDLDQEELAEIIIT